MEPQGRGKVPARHTPERDKLLGLSKTTLESRGHVQTVGLNAETTTCRHRAEGEECLLTFPFISLIRERRQASPQTAQPMESSGPSKIMAPFFLPTMPPISPRNSTIPTRPQMAATTSAAMENSSPPVIVNGKEYVGTPNSVAVL